jgi:hypothetical protein
MKSILEKLKFQDALAMLMLVLIMAYFFWVSRPGYTNTNATEIKQILGVAFGLILGFYYGSSKSSANKDQALSDALKNTQTNV